MTNLVYSYIGLFESLRKELKWKVTDRQVLMSIAAFYLFGNKPLDMKQLIHLNKKIKSHAGIFTSLTSNHRYLLAANLAANKENPDTEIPKLFDLYNQFRKETFKGGPYTYIAAMILLLNEQEQPSVMIQRAKDIHDGMKRNHLFLTGTNDYPLATLLALRNRSDVLTMTKKLYEELNKNGFSKGNNLQLLSHILTLEETLSPSEAIHRCTQVFDELKRGVIRPKQMYYPAIGMLALLPQNHRHIDEVKHIYQQLKDNIKWQKDMNLIIAISLYVHDKIEEQGLLEASISTMLEMILQIQQAVFISAVTPSSSDGGN